MDPKEPAPEEILRSCSEVGPEDGVDPKSEFRIRKPRIQNRKALQLCGQIARTLTGILAWETGDPVLRELIVESVVPAPHSGQMLVTVSAPAEAGDTAIIDAHLNRARGRLRSEIAAVIHRKKVPLLVFRVIRQP